MKPKIGIPTDELIEVNPVMPNNHPAYAPHDLKEAFIKLDALPLIIAFPDDVSQTEQLAQDYVQLIDGLMLPGGPDVDPTFYGEEPHPKIGMTLYQKDLFEIALIKAALAANKPIFGICRGIQIMNVAMGGTLYQDLESQYPDLKIQHPQATLGQFATHHVDLTPDSRLAALYGKTTIKVNSRHHQAVKTVGKGMRVTAVAPDAMASRKHVATRRSATISGFSRLFGSDCYTSKIRMLRLARITEQAPDQLKNSLRLVGCLFYFDEGLGAS